MRPTAALQPTGETDGQEPGGTDWPGPTAQSWQLTGRSGPSWPQDPVYQAALEAPLGFCSALYEVPNQQRCLRGVLASVTICLCLAS